MPRFYRVLRALVAVLLAAGALAPGTRTGTVKVAATIFPLHDIARQVAGSVADVALVLPPGASPHTFEPTPASVRELSGAGGGDQVDDHRQTRERPPAPIAADIGEQSMLDLVPLARSEWEVADGDRHPDLVGHLLQLPLPQAHSRAVAPAAVGGNEQRSGARIPRAPHLLPPPPLYAEPLVSGDRTSRTCPEPCSLRSPLLSDTNLLLDRGMCVATTWKETIPNSTARIVEVRPSNRGGTHPLGGGGCLPRQPQPF
jgi:hypothetical protein